MKILDTIPPRFVILSGRVPVTINAVRGAGHGPGFTLADLETCDTFETPAEAAQWAEFASVPKTSIGQLTETEARRNTQRRAQPGATAVVPFKRATTRRADPPLHHSATGDRRASAPPPNAARALNRSISFSTKKAFDNFSALLGSGLCVFLFARILPRLTLHSPEATVVGRLPGLSFFSH